MCFKTGTHEPYLDALEYAKANGGMLHRLPGGYWVADKDRGNHPESVKHFGTKTVQALVTRGAAEYTDHRTGRHGEFPVAMKAVQS
jgi:hypothetical protein